MWKALISFIVGAFVLTSIYSCKSEAKFGSSIKRYEESDGIPDLSNPNDPDNPGNTGKNGNPDKDYVGDDNQKPDGKPNPDDPNDPDNPGYVPGGNKGPVVPGGGGDTACVDSNGDEKAATLTNFPSTIQACIRGDVGTRGMYNFDLKVCEKIKFSAELSCTKEVLRAKIKAAGMNVSEFDSYAASDAVFFSGGCGQISMPGGHTAIILQFFKLPKAAYDAKTCTYNVSGGSVVTGCYITATDNSWTSLTSDKKVARCFAEAPRK